jgi:hypothetical protein
VTQGARADDDRGGPVFIAGLDRTGKTLLAAMLGSHSRIAISAVGSNMWTLFYGRFGDLADDRNAERCIAEMLAYKHVAYLQPDAGRLRRDFLAGPRSYGRLFALFQEQHAERLRKPRWGDQTGLVERYADEILAAYPDAVMIHVIRDPRDRFEAALRMWPDGRLGAGGATARWVLSSRLAERNGARHAARYRVLRYEDLVHDPDATLRSICALIGEVFEPTMLAMGAMPTYRAKLSDGRANSDDLPIVSDAYVGRFRDGLRMSDIRFIQDHAGQQMRRLGYESVPVPMGVGERVRYELIDRPRNIVRAAAWRMRNTLATRLPRWFGTAPRRGMMRA